MTHSALTAPARSFLSLSACAKSSASCRSSLQVDEELGEVPRRRLRVEFPDPSGTIDWFSHERFEQPQSDRAGQRSHSIRDEPVASEEGDSAARHRNANGYEARDASVRRRRSFVSGAIRRPALI
jgi:hypothetical protein